MKLAKIMTALLTITFLAIAVFGVFAMGGGNHGDCIAAMAQGVACPKEASLLGFVTFHLDAFKSFSLATIANDSLIPLLTLILLAFSFGLWLHFADLIVFSRKYSRYLRRKSWVPPQVHKILHWLSLHENSPSYS